MDVYVTLDLDDGSTECSILSIFDVQDQSYIALLPLDEDGNPNEAGEVYLYRYLKMKMAILLENILMMKVRRS